MMSLSTLHAIHQRWDQRVNSLLCGVKSGTRYEQTMGILMSLTLLLNKRRFSLRAIRLLETGYSPGDEQQGCSKP